VHLADAVRTLLTPVRVRKSREAWKTVAQKYGLVFRRGPHLRSVQGDRLDGSIDASRVTVSADANYDLQKIVVVVSVELEGVASSIRLGRAELVAWYGERRTAVPELPTIDQEFEQWVLGRKHGIGASAEDGRLVYRQLFGIDDPATLGFLIEQLTNWSRQIALVASASGEIQA